MNEKINQTLKLLQHPEDLSNDEKEAIVRSLKEAEKQLSIAEFKIERLEKLKHTTTVLLEQTIEELESKRKHVEEQKRELEIEAALERVRAIAMGMRKPADMLDVCRTIADELQILGVAEIRNVQTAIFYEEKGTYMNYEFYVKHDRSLVTEVSYKLHPAQYEFAFKMLQGPDEFFQLSLKGQELRDWYEYQKTTPQFVDSFLETASSLNYYWYSMGPVALGLSTYAPLSEEQIALFKRFRNVFELSYRRYLDIEKAEEQAREAQIEAALEKVRSRTLAMQNSNELNEVVFVLYVQLQQLGFVREGSCNINIMDRASGDVDWWMTGFGSTKHAHKYHVKYFEHPAHKAQFEAWENGKTFTTIEVAGDLKKEFDKEMLNQADFVKMSEETKKMIASLDSVVFSMAFMKYGALSWAANPISVEHSQILHRFAKVFEQTYTRFLDLQKAEAQAREARIEAALEKVRSRSLAMHRSDELPFIARTMFEQLRSLGLELEDGLILMVFKEGSNDQLQWPVVDGLEMDKMFLIPELDDPIIKKVYEARANGVKFIEGHFDKASKDAFLDKVFSLTDYRDTPIEFQKQNYAGRCYHYSFAMEKYTGVLIQSFNRDSYPPEHNDILRRFSRVFEQAYVRFLDLQKAEAQAREAQIEAGLERVRSRAMGMQSSEELKELIGTVFTELTKLDLVLTRCVIWVFDSMTNGASWWMANSEDPSNPMSFFIKYHEHPAYLTFLKEWRSQSLRVVYDLKGQDKIEWDKILFNETELRNLPDAIKEGMSAPDRVLLTASFNNFGALNVASLEPLSDEHFDILLRFAKVFDLTYTRFLDLQKAESQAREAKIQLALERVRARTMAMQQSNELSDTAQILFQQFKQLGEDPIQITIGIFNEEQDLIEFRITGANGSGEKIEESFSASIDEPTLINKMFRAWKENKKSEIITLEGQELVDWIAYRNGMSGKYAYQTKVEPGDRRHVAVGFFSKGLLSISTIREFSDETIQILERFASVFDLTYTRFLDLKQAEKQAREAQIESALEKVRSRSLAMHDSGELDQVITTLRDRLEELGLTFDGALIFLFDREKKGIQLWIATKQLPAPVSIDMPYDPEIENNIILKDLWHAVETGEHIFNWSYSGEAKNEYFRYVVKYNESKVPEPVRRLQIETESWTGCFAAERNSLLGFDSWSGSITSEEDFQILIRFARVFEQAYIRFLDLKNAEAQAREAQIEGALEKVRSRSLAMHKSDELKEAGELLWNELGKLGIGSISSGYVLMDKEEKIGWTYAPNPATGKISEPLGCLHTETKEMLQVLSCWRKQESFSVVEMNEEETIAHQTFIAERALQLDGTVSNWITAEQLIALSPKRLFLHNFNFKQGYLMIVGGERLNDKQIEIMLRFTKVFQQTYTRFLDLQKAEEQAREAQIAGALEKIRSSSLAMHHSSQINEVVNVLYEKLKDLGLEFDGGAAIVLFLENSKDMAIGVISPLTPPTFHALPYDAEALENNFILLDLLNQRIENNDLINKCYSFEQKNTFFAYVFKHNGPVFPQAVRQAILNAKNYTATFIAGRNSSLGVNSWTEQLLSEENIAILRRVGSVFEQAYIRFLDLQKAEAQAREAQIEAALEKVRSRTLAMQHSDELAETAAVLFQQLIQLGIEPNRLYIGITDDYSNDIEFWITDEDGSKVSTMFKGDASKNVSMKKMVDAWKQQKKSIVIDMRGKELDEYFHYLGEELHVPFKGGLSQKRRWQYIAFFSKGFIGMASPEEQKVEVLQLLERFAYVFNLTFTRFNDLKTAEAHALQAEQDLVEIKAARRRAEEALKELKATQAQLIQSEKMASLGELTAGIAHEIQNPLNFVNNFSEVSTELLEEIKMELDKGDVDEAKLIVEDVKQNLAKITHHGKRADGIVKSMLQHSRKGSSKKDLVDVNALVDEYLRMSYHGFRAKDKSFNAILETHFDPEVKSVSIIGQDMGRVLLNLFNNAFYAVNERKKAEQNGFEPIIQVTTSKLNGSIEIRVKDNGTGIPVKVLEKIYQPFFTTKPTGEGTGLGLSLSYDIITKGHSGDMKVKTKEGEGSEFIIQLPNLSTL